MEELDGVTSVTSFQDTQNTASTGDASDAFGLQFESLLQIILTQLTFQDPLKPIENFEFVSQLAQFSQIQQAETTNEYLQTMLQSDAASQAVGLLGQEVQVPAGPTLLVGRVVSISFENAEPRLTLETDDEQTIQNINLNNVIAIRERE